MTTDTAAGGAGDRPPSSSQRNPLIDDLIGELVNNNSNPSISNATCDGTWPAGGASSAAAAGEARIALEAVTHASQSFVHTLQRHHLEGYVTAPSVAEKEKEVRSALSRMGSSDIEALVLSLMDTLEDVRTARGQIHGRGSKIPPMLCADRPRSGSIHSTFSTASMMRPPVHETSRLDMAYDQSGNKVINRYSILAELGQGSYGKVKLGEGLDTGRKVAIKIIEKRHLQKKYGALGSSAASSMMKREIAIMKKVRHHHCVSLYEVIDDPASQKLYMIMDYIPNGPIVRLAHRVLRAALLEAVCAGTSVNGVTYCKHLMRCMVRRSGKLGTKPLTRAEIESAPTLVSCKPIRESRCALYLRQLVSGLRYLHKRNVVHHDIKPDNILLGNDNNVYLTDFGVSEMLEPEERSQKQQKGGDGGVDSNDQSGVDQTGKMGAGTLLFTAPELFSEPEKADPFSTDVWALGVTLYCMLVGMTPFSGDTYGDLSQCIQTQPFPWSGRTLESTDILPAWRTVLSGLLEKDPAKRWTLTRLKAFLDSDKFQSSMVDLGDMSPVGGASTVTSFTVLPLDATSLQASSSRRPSVGAGGSAGAGGAPSSTLSKFRDLAVSQRDVDLATRTEYVQVINKVAPPISTPARARVQSYVHHVRSSLAERHGKYYHIKNVKPLPTVEDNSLELPPMAMEPRGSLQSNSLSTGRMQILDAMLSIINIQTPSASHSFGSSSMEPVIDAVTRGSGENTMVSPSSSPPQTNSKSRKGSRSKEDQQQQRPNASMKQSNATTSTLPPRGEDRVLDISEEEEEDFTLGTQSQTRTGTAKSVSSGGTGDGASGTPSLVTSHHPPVDRRATRLPSNNSSLTHNHADDSADRNASWQAKRSQSPSPSTNRTKKQAAIIGETTAGAGASRTSNGTNTAGNSCTSPQRTLAEQGRLNSGSKNNSITINNSNMFHRKATIDTMINSTTPGAVLSSSEYIRPRCNVVETPSSTKSLLSAKTSTTTAQKRVSLKGKS